VPEVTGRTWGGEPLGRGDCEREVLLVLWVTGQRPTVGRTACAWLIGRFIDPLAQFAFAPEPQVFTVASQQHGRSYDSVPAWYGREVHDGKERCTFEVLLAEFALTCDGALVRLGHAVHAADAVELEQDSLAAGLLALATGALDSEPDDQRLTRRLCFAYDALYAWCLRETAATVAR